MKRGMKHYLNSPSPPPQPTPRPSPERDPAPPPDAGGGEPLAAANSLGEARVKVTIFMLPGLLQRLRQHAAQTRSSVSQICRDGALRELEAVLVPLAEVKVAP